MRTWLRGVRWRWARIPVRIRTGAVIAVLAIAGLAWQHDDRGTHPAISTPAAASVAPEETPAAAAASPNRAAVPEDASPAAARGVAERFAINLASPHGDRGDWLARIAVDVVPGLLAHYQDTDLSTIAQTTVLAIAGPMGTDPAVATFDVDFGDGSGIEVTLERGEQEGWKVSSVVPVSPRTAPSPDPPPPPPPTPPSVAGVVIPVVARTP